MSLIPNLFPPPLGSDEKTNKIIHKIGNIRKFSFTIDAHLIFWRKKQSKRPSDSKLSGSRFVILKSNFALLERALINFMLDIHTENGYKEISPPLLVNENVMFGTGQLPKFEEDQFDAEANKEEDKKIFNTYS